jgi:hypothetical protein
MNFAGSLLVAARGSAVSASDRGIGSANGNRTRLKSSEPARTGSKQLILRQSTPIFSPHRSP